MASNLDLFNQLMCFKGEQLQVPLEKIPNLLFAKAATRMQTRLFFPSLFTPTSNWMATTKLDALCSKLYDTCLKPAIDQACPGASAHWPADYEHAKILARKDDGTYHFRSLDINPIELPDFEEALIALMDAQPDFQYAFWEHEVRGSKDATLHAMNDPAARQFAFDNVMSLIDQERIDPTQWKVDVAVEINTINHNLVWLTLGHARLLEYALPGVTPPQIQRLMNSMTRFHKDSAAHLSAIAGFRASPGRNGGADAVSYINVYTTDKTNTYQQWRGVFKRHDCRELMPKNIPKLRSDFVDISAIFDKCAGGEEDSGQDGHARFEIRVPLEKATEVMTRDLHAVITHCVVAVPNYDWW